MRSDVMCVEEGRETVRLGFYMCDEEGRGGERDG